MANIELVIKIPEELYKANHRGLEADELWDLRIAIKNGTMLPKEIINILDKIRDEIKTMSSDIETISDVLAILDKYTGMLKQKSEE